MGYLAEEILIAVATAYLLIRAWQWIFARVHLPRRSRLGIASILSLLSAAGLTVTLTAEPELVYAAAASAFMLPTLVAALLEMLRQQLQLAWARQ